MPTKAEKANDKLMGKGWLSVKFYNNDGIMAFEVIGKGKAGADKLVEAFKKAKDGKGDGTFSGIHGEYGGQDILLITANYSAITVVDLGDAAAMQIMIGRRREAMDRLLQPVPGAHVRGLA